MVSLSYISQQYTIYLGCFLFIFGIVGNIINIFLLFIQRLYRTIPCNFFFLIACVHSTILLMIGLLYRILVTGFKINIDGKSVVFCKLRQYLFYSCAGIPITCMTLVTIDQFLITSRIVRFRQLSTIKNAHRAVICVITFWMICCIPYIIFSDISSLTNMCLITNSSFDSYAIFYNLIVQYGIPVLVMIIFGFLASRNIKRTVVLVRHGVDRQWMRMIRIQVILIIISMIPYLTFNIYSMTTSTMTKDSVQLANESFVRAFTSVNTYIQHVGSFYIFLISSSRYRQLAKTHLLCRRNTNIVEPQT